MFQNASNDSFFKCLVPKLISLIYQFIPITDPRHAVKDQQENLRKWPELHFAPFATLCQADFYVPYQGHSWEYENTIFFHKCCCGIGSWWLSSKIDKKFEWKHWGDIEILLRGLWGDIEWTLWEDSRVDATDEVCTWWSVWNLKQRLIKIYIYIL